VTVRVAPSALTRANESEDQDRAAPTMVIRKRWRVRKRALVLIVLAVMGPFVWWGLLRVGSHGGPSAPAGVDSVRGNAVGAVTREGPTNEKEPNVPQVPAVQASTGSVRPAAIGPIVRSSSPRPAPAGASSAHVRVPPVSARTGEEHGSAVRRPFDEDRTGEY
jgi:hypothetical protein